MLSACTEARPTAVSAHGSASGPPSRLARSRSNVRRSARSARPSASARSSSVRGSPRSCLSSRACRRRSTPSGSDSRARSPGSSNSRWTAACRGISTPVYHSDGQQRADHNGFETTGTMVSLPGRERAATFRLRRPTSVTEGTAGALRSRSGCAACSARQGTMIGLLDSMRKGRYYADLSATLLVAVLLGVGCASTYHEIVGKGARGQWRVFISCGHNIGECYVEAGRACHYGYTLVSASTGELVVDCHHDPTWQFAHRSDDVADAPRGAGRARK
jgi:hypothetical protein